MITVSYNAYCAISKEGDNDIWTVRPREFVPLLPLCSQIDVGATVNALLGDTFSHENNTHGSQFHDQDPQFASRILGAMTQSCYIGTCDIRSRVIRGPYCNGLVPSGNKPLPEPMSSRPRYMSPYGVTRPQWVKFWKVPQNGCDFHVWLVEI